MAYFLPRVENWWKENRSKVCTRKFFFRCLSKNQIEGSLKIPIAHEVFSFFFFSWLMIRWQKKRANKFPRWMRGVFVSYWLEYLIHIHNSVRVFAHYISNSSSMSEDVFPAAVWGPILLQNKEDSWCWKDLNAWKGVLTLLQPKVSIAFGKHSLIFFRKSHECQIVAQASWTRGLAAHFECRFILNSKAVS